MLGFVEEGTAGPLRLLSSSVVVQIKSKMIYAAKRGDDFVRGGTAPGIDSLSAAEPAGRRRYGLGHLSGFFMKHRTTR